MSESTAMAALTGTTHALVFPGQGSQFVGMGRALYDASPAARRTFDEADQLLGFPLSGLCFDGPADELEYTWNSQSAIFVASVAALRALDETLAVQGARLNPAAVAGHSLGEFTALFYAGVMDFAETLRVVRERGRLMKEAGGEAPGGMAAVLGLERDALEADCARARSEGIILVANDNCPGQLVISGEIAPLTAAMQYAKDAGAKRVARLGISIASHSPLMQHASGQLARLIAQQPMNPPRVPVIANASGDPLTTVEQVRAELEHHVENPVNWTTSIRRMAGMGVTTFIEIGPGSILSGLIKRIERDATLLGLADFGLPVDGKR
ncbi:MAG: ACP S-malonyltransferase [Thermomicrobiales bacterium]